MIAASQTTGTTGGIWAIVIVAVLALAFWLTAIVLADRSQVRASGRARLAGEIGPVPGGTWADRSVPGERAVEIPQQAAHEPTGAPVTAAGGTGGTGAPGEHPADEAVPQAEKPTRTDIPAQSAAHPAEAGRPEMPRQRTGDTDQAARSRAVPDPAGDDEPGR
jgi:hypothetical protein